MSHVNIRIDRTIKNKNCILGVLGIERPFGRSRNIPVLCYTLELPYRENKSNISSIPPGHYPAYVRTNGKHGWCIQLQGTAPREAIQIHIGNKPSDIEGCILVGMTTGAAWINDSGTALKKLKGEIYRDGANPKIRVDIYNRFQVEED